MRGGVYAAWIYALLALATARWWWSAFRALLADLQRAGEPLERPPVRDGLPRPLPLEAESRTPLNRVLAFRGVARRVAARQRWEAGFGRRGL